MLRTFTEYNPHFGDDANFIYTIAGHIPTEVVAAINAIDTRSKIKDRLTQIQAQHGRLKFYKTENATFANNLTLIDSNLPAILADILQVFYSSSHSNLIDLVDEVTQRNPLKFDQSAQHPFYSYKIRRFLTDIALGMMPSAMWTGKLDATGGYLVVKEDGDILAYHIYNRNFLRIIYSTRPSSIPRVAPNMDLGKSIAKRVSNFLNSIFKLDSNNKSHRFGVVIS